MIAARDEVLEAALALPTGDRQFLVRELAESLGQVEFSDDREPSDEVVRAWAEECRSRITAYDKGEIGSVPVQEMRDRLHAVFQPTRPFCSETHAG